MPRPGSAEPGRSTWNMAPESAGVRPPLNPRALGAGRANPSDDPGAGPWYRGPSNRLPGLAITRGAALRATGRACASTHRRASRSTGQPWLGESPMAWVPRDAAAYPLADPARRTAWREKERCRRATSESAFHVEHRAAVGGVAGALGGVAHAAGPLLLVPRADASNSGLGPPRLPPPDCRWAVVVPCGRACRLANADDGWRGDPAGACSGRTSPLDPFFSPGGADCSV